MVTRRDYNAEAVRAAHSVLIELFHLLGEYREHIALVGGWIPELLPIYQDKGHVGSIDVDLALDHRSLTEEGYRTIHELLERQGYRQGKQPFIFFRKTLVDGHEIEVQVDLLAGEYHGTGRKHRHQRVQDVIARKARGCDLAFEMPVEVAVEGDLPEGGKDSVTVRVASVVPFLVMKGMALHDRLKAKDAWDVLFCLKNYPGGIEALAREFELHMSHGLVREGLEKIAGKFATVDHIGPRMVADFEEIDGIDEREIIQRDAFERIQALLTRLGVGK